MTHRISLLCTLLMGLTHQAAAGSLRDDPSKQNFNWLAICPAAWAGAVEPLRAFRATQGYHAGLWTLEDVDATYGGHTPALLRQALRDAMRWPWYRPRWVVLIGDHNKAGGAGDIISDWKQDNEELGYEDPHLVGLWPYMDLDDDRVPDLFVGRVPAASATDVSNYITKLLVHERAPDPTYGRSLLLVYDDPVQGNDADWVRSLADSLYTGVAGGLKQSLVYSARPCCYPEQEAAALSAWNSGPGLVLAMGTGSGWWLLTGFFDLCFGSGSWNIDKLTASSQYPVVLALSCGTTGTDTGDSGADWTCGRRPIAEQLLLSRPDRGAAAVIGPTRGTKQYADFLLGRQLVVHRQTDRTWGEAFADACRDFVHDNPAFLDHVYEFVLEGDPAVQIRSNQVTGVEGSAASALVVDGPRPSPARGGTTIQYRLGRADAVRLDVFDVAGRRVRRLNDAVMPAGAHTARWDGRDAAGRRVAPGVYFVRVSAAHQVVARRLVLVR